MKQFVFTIFCHLRSRSPGRLLWAVFRRPIWPSIINSFPSSRNEPMMSYSFGASDIGEAGKLSTLPNFIESHPWIRNKCRWSTSPACTRSFSAAASRRTGDSNARQKLEPEHLGECPGSIAEGSKIALAPREFGARAFYAVGIVELSKLEDVAGKIARYWPYWPFCAAISAPTCTKRTSGLTAAALRCALATACV